LIILILACTGCRTFPRPRRDHEPQLVTSAGRPSFLVARTHYLMYDINYMCFFCFLAVCPLCLYLRYFLVIYNYTRNTYTDKLLNMSEVIISCKLRSNGAHNIILKYDVTLIIHTDVQCIIKY